MKTNESVVAMMMECVKQKDFEIQFCRYHTALRHGYLNSNNGCCHQPPPPQHISQFHLFVAMVNRLFVWHKERHHQYLVLGRTLSLHSDDVFSVNDVDSGNEDSVENSSGLCLVYRRRPRKETNNTGKKETSPFRCSFWWILFGLFVFLLVPMIGLSMSAGLKKRKIFRQHTKNMEDHSGFDQDSIVDKAFPPTPTTNKEVTIVPSKTPVYTFLTIEDDTTDNVADKNGPVRQPSSSPSLNLSDDQDSKIPVRTLMPSQRATPTAVPTTQGSSRASETPTLVPSIELLPSTLIPSIDTISPTNARASMAPTTTTIVFPTLGPSTSRLPPTETPTTTLPTTEAANSLVPTSTVPSLLPKLIPTVSTFSNILFNHTHEELTVPPNDTTDGRIKTIYIGVGDKKDLSLAGVVWLADRLFQSGVTSIATTLPCMDMKQQPLRALFCTVRVGDQSYEIPFVDIPVTTKCTVVLYVYNDGESFTVSVEDKVLLTNDAVGVYQVTTPSFVVKDSILSIRVEGDVALAALAIVPEAKPVQDIVDDSLEEEDLTGETNEEPVTEGTKPNNVIPTYIPGDLQVDMLGLSLSQGLQARLMATSGKTVEYANGSYSEIPFHVQPDAGATYALDNGGWIYVSNSEAKPDRGDNTNRFPGGVGAFTFSADGEIVKYEMVLNGTRANCGGGRTPWGAWISGEEYHSGKIWQVDPNGKRPARQITMGEVHSGLFESFAYDIRDMDQPRFFMTKDDETGALRRFTPTEPDWSNPWEILVGEGLIDYLVVEPTDAAEAKLGRDSSGTFYWETDYDTAAGNARLFYPHTEGIDVNGNRLYFVTKRLKLLFILDLDLGTYKSHTTDSGLFSGQPDQLVRMFEDHIPNVDNTLVYFTEDGGKLAGVHARNVHGQFFTVLESYKYSDETTGLSFSPDAKHLYVAYQANGLLFDVTRTDGLPFYAKTLDLKYHNTDK